MHARRRIFGGDDGSSDNKVDGWMMRERENEGWTNPSIEMVVGTSEIDLAGKMCGDANER